jgi:hypothetical protein
MPAGENPVLSVPVPLHASGQLWRIKGEAQLRCPTQGFLSGFDRFPNAQIELLFFEQLEFNRIALSLPTSLDWFWSYIRSEHLE